MAAPTELLMTEGTADAPPQPVTTLYVGNLPPTVDEQILFQTFRPFGHIPDIQVAHHPLFRLMPTISPVKLQLCQSMYIGLHTWT